jgi:two-component system sensor histidine kinase GlrK
MKLGSKIFLTCVLVIVVVGGVSAVSLRAIGRLVSANREVATQAVPALGVSGSVRDSLLSLARIESRYLVLRDPSFAALWEERAARTRDDLERLRGYGTSARAAGILEDVLAQFRTYRRVVAREHELLREGRRATALALAEGEARELIERMDAGVEAWATARQESVLAAQAEAAHLEQRTWAWVLGALGAAVVLGLAGAAWIAYHLTRSLRSLASATQQVGAGAACEPIAVSGTDEVAKLADAFNAMTARLRRVDEMKEEFIATISHELRSPLTSVREAASLLGDGVPGPLNPKQRRLVSIVASSADRLLRLVNQILDFSRMRAGMQPIRQDRVDVERLAERAVDELRPRAEEAGVTLERERIGGEPVVTGDEDRLMQVIVNLVANAIRFTPKGGHVTVRTVDADTEVEIQVDDTGRGIPAPALPYIFEWYRQAHQGRGGTGLGLAIARSAVEAHGGRITVESQEGKGSRFSVLLPRGSEVR